MKKLLIIIRGNSGSGKTRLAKYIQDIVGEKNCFIVHQDIVRREILHTNDSKNNPSINLMKELADFGFEHYPISIIEGILRKDVYGEMLTQLSSDQRIQSMVLYLDYPFNITIENDQKKKQPFGKVTLQKWWRENDVLTADDIRIKDEKTLQGAVSKITKLLDM
ncbi:zeta toxin family protein [Fructobacillus papyrifericola]|uniref:UDP-N-acetylglucosamine kinase n=1 Tax=Fructobacillus papyrifericola TaxID=2713172 RepID=A0ABS5QUC3_9LACO|nr:zeta toxin family protein [Fructobacillus papyrifericola]MBS9336735.1 kinase [Fructobacillus papyrifericola]